MNKEEPCRCPLCTRLKGARPSPQELRVTLNTFGTGLTVVLRAAYARDQTHVLLKISCDALVELLVAMSSCLTDLTESAEGARPPTQKTAPYH
jgi:hypothetical protein